MADESPERILRIKTVLERTGLSRSTLYRKIESGTFPKQVRIAARCAGWRESAVNEWQNNPMFYSVDEHPDARRASDVGLMSLFWGSERRF